jgi:hypothetical protein
MMHIPEVNPLLSAVLPFEDGLDDESEDGQNWVSFSVSIFLTFLSS